MELNKFIELSLMVVLLVSTIPVMGYNFYIVPSILKENLSIAKDIAILGFLLVVDVLYFIAALLLFVPKKYFITRGNN